MSGRRPLTGWMPRMLGRHDGAEGARFRRAWRALVAEYGQPARGSLLALEMGRVAVAYSNLLAASEALATVRRARATGRGRRPSERSVERCARRQGLADASYSQAIDKLGLMVAAVRAAHPRDPLDGMLEAMRREPVGRVPGEGAR